MIRALSWKTLLLVLVLLLVANILIYRAMETPRVLTVSVFETGKGRAIVVVSPTGRTLLVDTGSDASILRALGEVLSPWRRSLDVVIPLKAGAGLAEVERRYRVGAIVPIGTESIPYGAPLLFDTVPFTVSPDIFSIWYGATTLWVSSSTPPGAFVSDGVSIREKPL